MHSNKVQILERTLHREREARKEAEKILEQKSLELWQTNQRIEALLDDQSTQLKLIVDTSPLGIILTEKGKLVKINNALIKLLGYSKKELMHTDINRSLIHPEDFIQSSLRNELLEKNKIDEFSIQKRYKKKNGNYVLCKTNVKAIRDTKGLVKYQLAIIEDITEIDKKTKILDALNKLSVSILGKRDLQEIAWEIARNTAEHLNLEDCVVYSLHHDTNTLTQIAGYSNKIIRDYELDNPLSVTVGTGIVGIAAKKGKHQLVNDTSKNKNYQIDDIKRNSELAMPIIANGKVIGVIDSENSKKNYFNQEHVEVFKSIANLASAQFNSAISQERERKIQKEKDILLSQLEKNNDELKSFAHVVSHDLKSPLRSMAALVSWIKEDNSETFDKETNTNCDLILDKIDKMDALINGILKYSSIDKMSATKEKINLHILVNEIIENIYIPDHIKIIINTKLPSIAIGDKFRFKQLFQNLISNAIKYNDKEEGKIVIDAHKKEGTHVFSISDNGIGIEKKYHHKIFKVFETLGKTNENSTGIGLSIVKKIIDMYDGKIWIESKVNDGTTFYFAFKNL
ncbi:ATP-binding protein [Tenacibaculum sp. SG-28]|uniref:ATP-binding protein n=1 Tax=Tenacibaculum sp. SG-28 TaxID=754426 RepID=UPI000D423DA6|nr:ATP-binding protein [Tenacibaculum sp. SG-28]PQJ23136.1 hypothetical protein BSU00_02540 [Tenacibaculum sp. SG-28]